MSEWLEEERGQSRKTELGKRVDERLSGYMGVG